MLFRSVSARRARASHPGPWTPTPTPARAAAPCLPLIRREVGAPWEPTDMVAPVCPGFPSDTERGGPPEVDPGGGSLTPMGLLWSEAVWGALGSLSAHGQHVHPQKTGNHPEEAGGFREEVLGLRSGSCGRQLAPGSTGRARRQGASRRRGTCFHPVRPSTGKVLLK